MSADTLAERVRAALFDAVGLHPFRHSHMKLKIVAVDGLHNVGTQADAIDVVNKFALSELSAAEQAARKDEREQCATLADEITIYTNDDCSRVRNRIVTAIRNRE